MSKAKVGICGYVAQDKIDFGGQPVKTRNLINELRIKLGSNEVNVTDTNFWKRRKFKLLLECVQLIKNSRNIIIMPAANGILVFAPLFYFLNLFYSRKLHYVVIGGWIGKLVKSNPILKSVLKKFDAIFVETNLVKEELEINGFKNVKVLPNFKRLKKIEVAIDKGNSLKACTFSRIIKEKGIDDAIKAVTQLNNELQLNIQLDIYGSVYDEFREEFELLVKNSSNKVRYKGLVSADYSVQTISKYHLQLFPTKFLTEGVPGSIIDSYFAAVPILAAKWESYDDVIEEGRTGFGFTLGNFDEFKSKLKFLAEDVSRIRELESCCLEKSAEFDADIVIDKFLQNLC